VRNCSKTALFTKCWNLGGSCNYSWCQLRPKLVCESGCLDTFRFCVSSLENQSYQTNRLHPNRLPAGRSIGGCCCWGDWGASWQFKKILTPLVYCYMPNVTILDVLSLLWGTINIPKFWPNYELWGPLSISTLFTNQGHMWHATVDHGLRLHAGFHLELFTLLPLMGENPKFDHIFNCNILWWHQ